MLGELKDEGRIVIGDLEAGIGTVLRLERGDVDLVLIVAQPTVKSLDVAARALRITANRSLALVVANRVRDQADVELIRAALGQEHELVEVPEDAVIAHADEQGTAPIDSTEASPGVDALIALAERIRTSAVRSR